MDSAERKQRVRAHMNSVERTKELELIWIQLKEQKVRAAMDSVERTKELERI